MPRWGRTRETSPVVSPDGLPTAATSATASEDRGLSIGEQLSDPATAVLLGGTPNYSGEYVSEASALSLSAVWRSVLLIAQAGGGLPLKTYRELDGDVRNRESSIFDNPAGTDSLLTPFTWKETIFLHCLLRGEACLLHVRNQAGALAGLLPVHPAAVAVYADTGVRGGERYTVSLDDGQNLALTPYGSSASDPGMTRIVGPRTRGLRGWSPLNFASTSLGIGLAAERATARMFRDGALVQGVLTPAAGEDLSADDATQIRADLDQHLFGNRNAGTVPLVNRVLQFNQWQMSNVDAQFMENRQFQIEEVARWFGVPPHLLMALEKTTSWGTGIAEQNKNLAQYVLSPWCQRISERLSRLLPQPRWVEFDMAGLLAGSAKDESALLLSEVNGGLRTLNEARKIKNLPPLDGGDQLRIPSGVMLQAQLEASADLTASKVDDGTGPAAGDTGGDNGGTSNA